MPKGLACLVMLSVLLLWGGPAVVPAQAQGRGAPTSPAGTGGSAARIRTLTAASVGSGPIEELTVASLGLSAQTVYGPRTTVDVEFPAPGGPLAAQGNLVRVFFSHSAGLTSGSNLTIAVNGNQLVRVALDDTTAQGGVFDTQIPAGTLHQDATNEVEAEWTLTSPKPAQAFGRLAPETLLDYAVGGDSDSLATFPYSMLEGLPDTVLHVGIVLPQHPDGAEIGSVMSVVAAVAERLPGRRVIPQLLPVTTSDPAGEPLIVVGRSGTLPLLDRLLASAGFKIDRGGSVATGSGTAVPARDGVLATAGVPALGGARAWVVSGQSDEGIEKASRALVEGPGTYPGDAAVIDADAPVVTPQLPSMASLLAGARVVPDQLEQRIAVGFPLARPVRGSGTLRLPLLPGANPRAAGTLGVSVNGHPLPPVPSAPEEGRTALSVIVPAADLRPGFNGIALTLRASASTGSVPTLDLSHADLSLPRPAVGVSLRDLPDPFLGSGGGTPMVVLANHRPGLVQAALDGAAALGSRSLLSPPPFHVAPATGRLRIGDAGLIVFGVPGGGSQLRVSGSSGARIDPPRSSSGGGWVEDVRLPGDPGPILWVAGPNAAATARAASLLGSAQLGGSAATTRSPADTAAGANTVAEASLPELLTFGAAILVALWLVVVTTFELWRHRGWRRVGAR